MHVFKKEVWLPEKLNKINYDKHIWILKPKSNLMSVDGGVNRCISWESSYKQLFQKIWHVVWLFAMDSYTCLFLSDVIFFFIMYIN